MAQVKQNSTMVGHKLVTEQNLTSKADLDSSGKVLESQMPFLVRALSLEAYNALSPTEKDRADVFYGTYK